MPELPDGFMELPARVYTDGLRLIVEVAASHRIVCHLLEGERAALRRIAAGAPAVPGRGDTFIATTDDAGRRA